MILACRENDDHGHKGRDHEPKIDLEVGGQDEPAVTMAFLQLAGGFGGADRTGRTGRLASVRFP
jgi:hypothetical protein